MNLAVKSVTESFIGFVETSHQYMHIQSESDYHEALEIIEHIMLTMDDSGHDPLCDLLDIISKSVDTYESQLPDVKVFLEAYDNMPKDLATLKVLMEQYSLGVNDFKDEIGSKSYVSMILNEERNLNKNHIEKLCKRFDLSPELFF